MEKAILIDGNSLMYRAYYATIYGEVMTSSKGLTTNCIYAFYNMISKLKIDRYDYAVIAFDYGKKTFRHEKLESYKGGRAPMPEDLKVQVPYVKELAKILGLKVYEQELVEADDIVGTMARKFASIGVDSDIYSGDKDLLQLVDEHTKVYLTKKGVSELLEYNLTNFKELHQVYPYQVVDLKGLMGDASDNLKGVSGVGEKTAIKLLNEYQDLETIIQNADKMTPKLKTNLINDKEQALLCKELATINTKSAINLETEDCRYHGVDTAKLYDLFVELDFTTLITKIKTKKEEVSYQVLDETNLHLLNQPGISYFTLEYFDQNYHKARVLALSVTYDTTYIVDEKYFNHPEVKKYLSEASKITYDLKASIVLFDMYGLKVTNVLKDAMLMAYVINPDTKDNIFDLCLKYGVSLASDTTVYGKGVKRKIPNFTIYYDYAAHKSFALKQVYNHLVKEMNETMLNLHNLELALSYTLAKMEITGIQIDLDVLYELKDEFNLRINKLTHEIYLETGMNFNINSPKQLGTVLFEHLGLPYPKKKKDSYSTSSDILEQLKTVPVVEKILEYRKLSKLVSTYLEGMQNVSIDSRVHTIYKQALTTTGRLSSIEPNMQNIPIRSEEGRSIRKMFTTDKTFIGLDYSQIELRVLAHLSGDEVMINAFKSGEDIHRATAAKINHKALEEVTKEERSLAKAVNFGIIYGQTAFGLAEELHISVASAKEFIAEYYSHYPKIKEYLDSLVTQAKEKGYAETMLGRRRYLNLNTGNFFQKEFAMRTSLNTPIQGSAADIIKLAMVNLDKALEERNLKSRIVLQIHDELIIEVEDGELAEVSKLAKEMMEHAVELKVPLIVDFNEANNLYDLK